MKLKIVSYSLVIFLSYALFEADTEAVTWFSGESSFGLHKSRAFGQTQQAPIQCIDVASKPRCRTSHHYSIEHCHSLRTHLGHVQVHTSAQRFATVSG